MSDQNNKSEDDKEKLKGGHFHPAGYVAHANQRVFNEIWFERGRQNDKWGEQNHHPFIWLAILGEEVGEANKACVEAEFGGYTKEQWLELREELIQIAAVAEAFIESLDRNELERD